MPPNNNDRELRRGDVVIVADRGSEFSGKPRPAIVMQRSDAAARLPTVTVCLLTSQPAAAPLLRVEILATGDSGLESPSWAMIDQLTTVRRNRIGRHIGRVDNAKMLEISQALLIFLGIGEAA
jgi:mRNA interferase MazF